MQIIFIARLYKPHVGGVESHIREISKRLTKKGHKISIITSKHDNKLKESEIVDRVKVFRIGYPKIKVIGLLTIWLKLMKLIDKIKKADIIHIHDVFIWYLPFKFLFLRKKVYMTFHGYPDYPIPMAAIIFQKIAQRLTKGNISVGDFIPKWFGTKANIITYGAVDISKYKPTRKEKFRYDAIFASRLDEQTGILTYLDAIKILRQKGIDFKLVVLGDGKYLNQTKELATTKGWVNDPSEYFQKSKFAFVNRYLAILEAFSCKKLVFAVYDNQIKKDYLFLTPYKEWVVIEKDPKKLADKISYYIKNSTKAEKMIDKACAWVKNQTWEKMTDNYEKLWRI